MAAYTIEGRKNANFRNFFREGGRDGQSSLGFGPAVNYLIILKNSVKGEGNFIKWLC